MGGDFFSNTVLVALSTGRYHSPLIISESTTAINSTYCIALRGLLEYALSNEGGEYVMNTADESRVHVLIDEAIAHIKFLVEGLPKVIKEGMAEDPSQVKQ